MTTLWASRVQAESKINYALADSLLILIAKRDFCRLAVPFLMTPLPTARSSWQDASLYNDSACSKLPSETADFVFLMAVLRADNRLRLTTAFRLSARMCLKADGLFAILNISPLILNCSFCVFIEFVLHRPDMILEV